MEGRRSSTSYSWSISVSSGVTTSESLWQKIGYLVLLFYLEVFYRAILKQLYVSKQILPPLAETTNRTLLSLEAPQILEVYQEQEDHQPKAEQEEDYDIVVDHDLDHDSQETKDIKDNDNDSHCDETIVDTITTTEPKDNITEENPQKKDKPRKRRLTMDYSLEKEFNVRDLTTKSVILFPARAQITREIRDIELQTGLNQITIIGLSPTVDPDSIKVEGAGAAIINDISVESLPNREHFKDIYPESDSSDDDLSDQYESDVEPSDAVKDAEAALTQVIRSLNKAREKVASAKNRLDFIQTFGSNIPRRKVGSFEENLETYRAEREKAHADLEAAEKELEDLLSQEAKAAKALKKVAMTDMIRKDKIQRERNRRARQRQKEKDRIMRQKEERYQERQRIREERIRFWPKKVFSVKISLEVSAHPPVMPPLSRRSSSSSVTEAYVQLETGSMCSGFHGEHGTSQCSILLTYMTSAAFWTPSYDLQLSTINNTAILCVDAILTNKTSETWKSCVLTLSNSNTNYSSLNDKLPELVPWRIKLRNPTDVLPGTTSLLLSSEEKHHSLAWRRKQRNLDSPSGDPLKNPKHNALFGIDESDWTVPIIVETAAATPGPPKGLLMAKKRKSKLLGAAAPVAVAMSAPMGQPGNNSNNNNGEEESDDGFPYAPEIGGSPREESSPSPPQRQGALFGSTRAIASVFSPGNLLKRGGVSGSGMPMSGPTEDSEIVFEGLEGEAGQDRLLGGVPDLEFAESMAEEAGLTTTYEIPGTKTLIPRSTTTKQRIARVNFPTVTFKYTVVAKYVPAAYLTATIRNSSKMTLLKGPVGLTLDNVFLGRSQLNHCATGSTMELSLGIDPAIRVVYPKPEVRRATSGFLSKEDGAVYTRSISISNTKSDAKRAAKIVVVDQVPVSQDAQLRVNVLAPRGLATEDVKVEAGEGLRLKGVAEGDVKEWGTAEAVLKKGGEVEWEVVLNPGRGVKLGLEYEVAMPAGETAVQC